MTKGGGATAPPFWYVNVDKAALEGWIKGTGQKPVLKVWSGPKEWRYSVMECRLPDGSELIFSADPILSDGAHIVVRCPSEPERKYDDC
jgi:hypothetical protein